MTHDELRIRRAAIAAACRNGDSLEDITRRFNVGEAAVASARKEHGAPLPRGPSFANRTYRIIAMLQNTDMTYETIGRQVSVFRQQVGIIYQKACGEGIKFPNRSPKDRHRQRREEQ